ncbi:hypothetical protein [Roseibium sp. LAB1]
MSAIAARRVCAAGAQTNGVFRGWFSPRKLIDAMTVGGAEAKLAFVAMMQMKKIGIAMIEKALKGQIGSASAKAQVQSTKC